MKKAVRILFFAAIALALVMPVFAGGGSDSGASSITIVGGTMLPDGHVYHRTIQKFEERMRANYRGPAKIDFSIHHSGTLGTEKDAVEFMIQGVAVDTYVVSPSWIATWESSTPIIDAPFVFRNIDHWYKTLESGVLKPIEDAMIRTGMRIIGFGGGSARHLISRIQANSVADFPRIRLRVQGSPVHQRAFAAAGFVAAPMDYMEVYNAIRAGVIDALENEPAGLQSMRFYEVAPYYVLTNHQIQTRVLGFSERRFQSFPADVQAAILISGTEASAFHREVEIGEADTQIADMARDNGLRVIQFDNTEMRRRAMPAVEAYADEIGAGDLLRAILAVQ